MAATVALGVALAATVEIPFIDRVDEDNRITRESLEILQVNVGAKCNLRCKHCHIQAGPDREELMNRQTMQACLDVLDAYDFKTLDITGGAPELNPDFEWFVTEACKRDVTVMTRCNLVILDTPEHAHLAELYARLGVQVVASLPHFVQKNTDNQRGDGTFDASIRVLQWLNALGYGKGSGLELNLVYNPGGPFLPGSQDQLEAEYRRRLQAGFDIVFDHLFAITNNPLGRFAAALSAKGKLQDYRDKLVTSFNPGTLPNMMCRNQLSVGWDGRCYDCDFNQAAELPCGDGRTIFDYRDAAQACKPLDLKRSIEFDGHCYACCAGSGSSCGGATG
ncbi:MAG TPA: radical SAM protein [Coriobacteriia bacterium]|nr:radical SAM protein [Coriobacteriia bacterium]